MNTTLRGRLAEALERQLGAISVEAGYLVTPRTVTRSLLGMDQYDPKTQWPLFGIVRGSGSAVQRLTGGKVEHTYVLNVYGYVEGDHPSTPNGKLAADHLEELWDAMHKCLRRDPTLGGVALDCDIAEGQATDTDDGDLEPQAYFRQPWSIRATESFARATAA